MNCNSALPSEESGCKAAHETCEQNDGTDCRVQAEVDTLPANFSHDLRASLAIVNGFSRALRDSFDNLQSHMMGILESGNAELSPDTSEELMILEADCRFCLSRLQTSMQKLRSNLERGQLLNRETTPEEGCG